MRASTKRILSVLLSGIFLISLVFVASSLIRPEFGRVMDKRAEIYSKDKIFNNRSKAVKRVNSLIKDTQGFGKLRDMVSLAIPLEVHVPEILSQLDAIARTSNISMNSFETNPKAFVKVGSGQLTKRLGVLEISLTASGDYKELKNFIRFIETNVRVFNIQSYNFNTVSIKGTNKLGYTMSVEFDAYYQEN